MPTTRRCAECGTPLPEDIPEAACPVCALRGALELPDDPFTSAATKQSGDRIGRYKPLEKIGEGGYGIVYLGEYAKADDFFRGIRERLARLPGSARAGFAAASFGMALTAYDQGRLIESEALAREELAASSSFFGGSGTLVVHSLNCLAAALEAQGKLAVAETTGRQALVIERKLPGNTAQETALTLTTLAKTLLRLDQSVQAKAYCREALARRIELHGTNHPRVAESFELLSTILKSQERTPEAEAAATEAKRIRQAP